MNTLANADPLQSFRADVVLVVRYRLGPDHVALAFIVSSLLVSFRFLPGGP